jgi:hypothetical protein
LCEFLSYIFYLFYGVYDYGCWRWCSVRDSELIKIEAKLAEYQKSDDVCISTPPACIQINSKISCIYKPLKLISLLENRDALSLHVYTHIITRVMCSSSRGSKVQTTSLRLQFHRRTALAKLAGELIYPYLLIAFDLTSRPYVYERAESASTSLPPSLCLQFTVSSSLSALISHRSSWAQTMGI